MTLQRSLARIAKMEPAEIGWRAKAAARVAWDRARSIVIAPRWNRRDLAGVLAPLPELAPVHAAVAGGDWSAAHRALAHHFHNTPQRFVIAPALRLRHAARIQRAFPHSAERAAARGGRILSGAYDLLGYHGLRFESAQARVDWHADPVHARCAPKLFWSTVPYLDPACGDHKIIWELNRHQHWLALGRAYWLTQDSTYRDGCIAELESWLDANPPLTGVNWASMLELGLRSLSWIWALNFFADPDRDDRSPWLVDLLVALDRQLTHIEHNLSYYFSPNTHLIGEGLALYVAGRTLPELAASPRREALGRQILLAEIGRQIAADGGHCERSAHYHRYALDFYLLALAVARITGDPIAAAFEDAVVRLGSAARLLADDRGHLPLIGDDDGGVLTPICERAADDARDSLATAAALVGRRDLLVGAAPEESFWMLAHPSFADAVNAAASAETCDPIASAALPDTGYYVSRSTAGDHLVVDGGSHGYQNGGHAHADALSLTLTVRGLPLLIDTGTGAYTSNPELRNRLRSTALHNTVVVDDRPQSVPRGPFHWSQTANATIRRWRANGSFDYFEGAHDGYLPTAHRRHVLALHGDLLIVADLIDGEGDHSAAAHWHVDPSWAVEVHGRRAVLSANGDQVQLAIARGSIETFRADEATGLGWHAPVYGRIEPTTTVRISDQGSAPFWIVSVFGLDPDNPIDHVDALPVWAEAGVLASSTAVRISRAASDDYCVVANPVAASGSSHIWRVAEFETDAHLLFCRVDREGQATRVALVDGSRARAAGRSHLQLALPRHVPDLHLDLSGVTVSEPLERRAAPRSHEGVV